MTIQKSKDKAPLVVDSPLVSKERQKFDLKLPDPPVAKNDGFKPLKPIIIPIIKNLDPKPLSDFRTYMEPGPEEAKKLEALGIKTSNTWDIDDDLIELLAAEIKNELDDRIVSELLQEDFSLTSNCGGTIAKDFDGDTTALADIEYFKERLKQQLERGHVEAAKKMERQLEVLSADHVVYKANKRPDKRIFYIDVGPLPKENAKKYMKTVTEDYIFPHPHEGKGSLVKTLPEAHQPVEGMLNWGWYPYDEIYKVEE